MELQLSKQYPFNFVALAYEILQEPIDDAKLAMFNAVEVDAFLHGLSETEQKAVEAALGYREKPGVSYKLESYKKALTGVVCVFERERLNGRFGLVSLQDFNNLAMSWAEIAGVIAKIDRLPDQFCAYRWLFEIRERLAMSLVNMKCYNERYPKLPDEELRDYPVSDFDMDSYGRQLLMENKINTVGDLTTVTADYLTNINGFGERRLENVRANLKALGTHLLGE